MTTVEYNACVDMYADNVYRFILKNIKDEAQAQDVVQESFTRLWEKHEEVVYESSKSYLFTMAYRIMIDGIRKHKREQPLPENIDQHLHHERQYSDLGEILEEALNTLPEIQRTVILLRDYEGYDYEQIGKITGLNASQVKVYIYRGRKKLKALLTRLGVVA